MSVVRLKARRNELRVEPYVTFKVLSPSVLLQPDRSSLGAPSNGEVESTRAYDPFRIALTA